MPSKNGVNQVATTVAVAPPANPSRDSTPAVVQVGAAPAAPNKTLNKVTSLSFNVQLTLLVVSRSHHYRQRAIAISCRLQTP
jgi:hypothetical protein